MAALVVEQPQETQLITPEELGILLQLLHHKVIMVEMLLVLARLFQLAAAAVLLLLVQLGAQLAGLAVQERLLASAVAA